MASDDSFKMGYQISNALKPNRPDNTITFSYFCAKDSGSNWKSCLSRFTTQIDIFQTLKFQEKRIRMFMYGDYEFLCIMYGLTGANGKFCGLNSALFFYTTKMSNIYRYLLMLLLVTLKRKTMVIFKLLKYIEMKNEI